MRTRALWLATVLVAAACGGEKTSGPSANGSAAAAPVPQAKPGSDPTPVAGSARPAAVTQEMNDTFEAFVSAFEKLSADLGAAAPDCAKGVAVVERHAKALDALDARGEAMRVQMAKIREAKDEAVIEWFAETYTARMKGAVVKMGPLVESCENDPAMKAGMTALMARFPMMRKKQT